MKPAIVEIHEYLLKAGLEDEEADELVSRLMKEEAEDYVNTICKIRDNLTEEELEQLVKEIKDIEKESYH